MTESSGSLDLGLAVMSASLSVDECVGARAVYDGVDSLLEKHGATGKQGDLILQEVLESLVDHAGGQGTAFLRGLPECRHQVRLRLLQATRL